MNSNTSSACSADWLKANPGITILSYTEPFDSLKKIKITSSKEDFSKKDISNLKNNIKENK